MCVSSISTRQGQRNAINVASSFPGCCAGCKCIHLLPVCVNLVCVCVLFGKRNGVDRDPRRIPGDGGDGLVREEHISSTWQQYLFLFLSTLPRPPPLPPSTSNSCCPLHTPHHCITPPSSSQSRMVPLIHSMTLSQELRGTRPAHQSARWMRIIGS